MTTDAIREYLARIEERLARIERQLRQHRLAQGDDIDHDLDEEA